METFLFRIFNSADNRTAQEAQDLVSGLSNPSGAVGAISATISGKMRSLEITALASGLGLYSPSPPGLPNQPFGKDIANFDLFQALARCAPAERVVVLSHGGLESGTVRQAFLKSRDEAIPEVSRLSTGSIFDSNALSSIGTLLRGTADLGTLAWQRRKLGLDRGYSLVGIVHTVAPPALRRIIAEGSITPLQPWDAFVCTSPAVRDNLTSMFDDWESFLRDRFAAPPSRPRRPSLPLVPLGIDGKGIAREVGRPGRRPEIRARLGLGEEDILVLWLGRLSFFEKAFPQPMFQAVEAARRQSRRRIAFALVGWFPGGEADRARYAEAARVHAPSVAVSIIDGTKRDRVNDLLAASDVFLSLVDNIQETFGLAPVEAMAAGLPIVASDWDGYRYTIEHGRQGFLIPTLGAPPGSGARILERHLFGLDSYQAYVGQLAQHTAVDVDAAAEAISRLALNPDLRRSMGEAGRARVATRFDWPVVVKELSAVFEALAAERANDQGFGESWLGCQDPVRSEPFAAFAGFASAVLENNTRLRLTDRGRNETAGRCELDRFGAVWRAPEIVRQKILAELALGPKTFGELEQLLPGANARAISATVMWFAKLGILAWDSPA